MVDTLNKKRALLDKIYQSTLAQEKYINSDQPDMDEYTVLYHDKEILIDELNKLDDGFEKIYEHVRIEMASNKDEYKDEILHMQNLIRLISERSAAIFSLEKSNKEKFHIYFSKQKQEIKAFKKSNQTVTKYYKSMTEGYGKDMFIDKKK